MIKRLLIVLSISIAAVAVFYLLMFLAWFPAHSWWPNLTKPYNQWYMDYANGALGIVIVCLALNVISGLILLIKWIRKGSIF